jgi:uroporphyrinogen decarboxylase
MNWKDTPEKKGEPDFSNLLAVLRGEVPKGPTLFEFYFNERLYQRFTPGEAPTDPTDWHRRVVKTFYHLGYDFTTVLLPGFRFTDPDSLETKETFSMDEGALIRSQKDFDLYRWPDPEEADYDLLYRLSTDLPVGMKLIPYSPDGVLENVIRLMGYSNLCLKLYDEPRLVEDVFEQVGSRLVQYYKKILPYECVGACIANDDWGFNSSTLLSPDDLRRFVFPWYKDIVKVFHAAGKPVILHSCGHFEDIIEDIIEDMHFDGRHSFEDNIMPVELAYEKYSDRLATLGGIDVNFICHSSPEEIYGRAKAMLERAEDHGGYALGTGNSVPEYIPDEKFFALIRAALDLR